MQRALAELDRVMGLYNLMAEAAGAGFALAVLAAYGQTLAHLYGAVTITIITMSAEELMPTVRQELHSFACNVAVNAFLAGFGALGRSADNATGIYGSVDNALTVLLGSDANPMPSC